MKRRARLLAAIFFLGGCASAPAAAPPAAPGTPASPAPVTAAPEPPTGAAAPPSSTGREEKKAADLDTLPDAEAALERASQELDRIYVAAGAPAAAPPAAAGAGQAPAAAARPAPRASAEDESASGGCETACKAFDSLRRAADAICRLAGETDARCARGRKLVDDNGKRVASCGC